MGTQINFPKVNSEGPHLDDFEESYSEKARYTRVGNIVTVQTISPEDADKICRFIDTEIDGVKVKEG